LRLVKRSVGGFSVDDRPKTVCARTIQESGIDNTGAGTSLGSWFADSCLAYLDTVACLLTTQTSDVPTSQPARPRARAGTSW
jgi:hypothetical protein